MDYQEIRTLLVSNVKRIMTERSMFGPDGSLSGRQLGKAAGLSSAYTRRILACESSPTIDTVGQIADALDVSPVELLAPEQLQSLVRQYIGTTDEGRKMIADIAALQPPG